MMALSYVVVMLCTLCMKTMVVQDTSKREQEQEDQEGIQQQSFVS